MVKLRPLTFKLRGWPPRNVNRAPKVQKPAGRERTLIGQSLSNVGLGRRMGAQAKQRPTPAPLYTAKREAATDKKPCRSRPAWPSPPTTPPGKTAAAAKSRHIKRSRKARRRARQAAPEKNRLESRVDIGSPPTMTSLHTSK